LKTEQRQPDTGKYAMNSKRMFLKGGLAMLPALSLATASAP
jgi:hypothetical protein